MGMKVMSSTLTVSEWLFQLLHYVYVVCVIRKLCVKNMLSNYCISPILMYCRIVSCHSKILVILSSHEYIKNSCYYVY